MLSTDRVTTLESFIRGGPAPIFIPFPYTYNFDKNPTPFVYLLLKKALPGHPYFIIGTQCNLFLNPRIEVRNRRDVSHKNKDYLFSWLSLPFPCLFIYLSVWNPYLSIHLKPEKGTPSIRAEPSTIVHSREYPLSPPPPPPPSLFGATIFVGVSMLPGHTGLCKFAIFCKASRWISEVLKNAQIWNSEKCVLYFIAWQRDINANAIEAYLRDRNRKNYILFVLFVLISR